MRVIADLSRLCDTNKHSCLNLGDVSLVSYPGIIICCKIKSIVISHSHTVEVVNIIALMKKHLLLFGNIQIYS